MFEMMFENKVGVLNKRKKIKRYIFNQLNQLNTSSTGILLFYYIYFSNEDVIMQFEIKNVADRSKRFNMKRKSNEVNLPVMVPIFNTLTTT